MNRLCFLIFFLFSAPALAQDISGTWTHVESKAETAKRYNAIEKSTTEISAFFRGKARKKLKAKTKPVGSITIESKQDTFSISGPDDKLVLKLGGKAVTKKGKEGTAKISAKQVKSAVEVIAKGEKGTQTTRYVLSKDKKMLVLHITMTNDKLSQPLRYEATYRRK